MSKEYYWEYNRYGHVLLHGPNGGEIYLQCDMDVESFFEHIGLDIDDIYPDDWDYFDGSEYFDSWREE